MAKLGTAQMWKQRVVGLSGGIVLGLVLWMSGQFVTKGGAERQADMAVAGMDASRCLQTFLSAEGRTAEQVADVKKASNRDQAAKLVEYKAAADQKIGSDCGYLVDRLDVDKIPAEMEAARKKAAERNKV